MRKIKIGVLGAYRGSSMINYCKIANNAEVVAICDKWQEAIDIQKENAKGLNITFYNNFDDFIKHDMDAVVLANYANEHAPFAIRAMKEGKHVFSEVLPVQTMKEAVELIEAIEETGMVYAYGENYCYMPAVYEMKKLYDEGKIGEFEYAEGEYIHNGEKIWPSITYGESDHWRNNMYSTFYCTHSLGPIIHITGERPVSVIGIETTMNDRNLSGGSKSANFGIEMVTFENGGIAKSIHGGLYKDSIWHTLYGSKGRMESSRFDEKDGDVRTIFVNADEYAGEYGEEKIEKYRPSFSLDDKAKTFGHAGSDFYAMYYFVEKLLGDETADIIDIYEALDMFLPGMFAYRSILKGSIPMEIPNLRNKAEREKYRNDTACTDPKVAGDMLMPTTKNGTPTISDEVYDKVKEQWKKQMNDRDDENSHFNRAFAQGTKEEND